MSKSKLNKANIKLLEELLKRGDKVNRFKRYKWKINMTDFSEYTSNGYCHDGKSWDDPEIQKDVDEIQFYEDVVKSFPENADLESLIEIVSITEGFYDEKGKKHIIKIERR